MKNEKGSDLELSQRNACPPGWSGFQSRCFLFVDEEKEWIEAEKYCIRLGGNLASVHSSSEYRFLQALTAGHSFNYPPTWIGAFDAVKERQWQWSDGTEFSYTRWNAEQPDNWHYNEHCVHMNIQSTKGWNDVECAHLYPFICAIRSTGCRKTSR
ncbi:ladderlectin-like [Megalops cyprinoides]|uniref:ladderlectin-like n=1 Tax=Megalops cyprinoides TaxID=118141 RepID=UPI001864C9A9|nr:ladderlectin-like [Megalops cyprinoides]